MATYAQKVLYGVDPRSGLGEFNKSVVPLDLQTQRFIKKVKDPRQPNARARFMKEHPYCYYCGWYLANRPKESSIDHKIPKSKGDGLRKDNIVLSCRMCNTEKGSMTDTEYIEYRKHHVRAKMGAVV